MTRIPVTSLELQEVESVLRHYPLDLDNSHIEKWTVWYVNTTFFIEKNGQKYVLRESHKNTEKEHVELEIEILQHLQKKQFPLTARVFENKEKKYITDVDWVFHILQNFLPGEVKASWNNLREFTPNMRAELFSKLAQFTKAVADFSPTKQPTNKNILYYVENFETLLTEQIQKASDSVGKDWLKKHQTELTEFARKTKEELQEIHYNTIPTQCVHLDMHPGNVHFDEKNTIVGIFDFDWAGFDTRFADIASTIAQSCYIFWGENTWTLVPEYVHRWLEAYRKSYGATNMRAEDENTLIRLTLQGYYLLQCIWSNNHYIETGHSEERFEIVRTFTNACLKNDLKEIFS